MLEEIAAAEANLRNTKAGWVARRDAADLLGQAAARAVSMLKSHEEDKDTDVRMAVGKALGHASAALAGIKPSAAPEQPRTLEDLARACEKPGERTVKPHENGFVVEVRLRDSRHQQVYMLPAEREGVKLVRVFTYCGEPSDRVLEWALRTNARLTKCATAIIEEEGKKKLLLTACFIESETTPPEIKSAVKEIAYYGDWIEQRLTQSDTL